MSFHQLFTRIFLVFLCLSQVNGNDSSKMIADKSSWFESFYVDAFACDLGFEPVAKEDPYQAGDFVRICIHTVSDNSDLVVIGLDYFVFATIKSETPEEIVKAAVQETHTPSFSCSDDNMCVVETILDETLFENNPSQFFGNGSLSLGRSGSNNAYETSLKVSLTLNVLPDGQQQPNLQTEGPNRNNFLRGSKEGA